MSQKIHVPVNGILRFYYNNMENLENNYLCVAENDTTGIEVYLSKESGAPCFTVELDGESIGEISSSIGIIENSYEQILETFVKPEPDSKVKDTELSESDMERLEEIDEAFKLFLEVLFEMDPADLDFKEDDADELLSFIEEKLSDSFGILIRHPMVLDGKVVEYPFDTDFEDCLEDLK